MKKIMFNDRYGLTQAVLDKIKTNTRRSISNKLWKKWDKVKTPNSTEEDLIRFLLDNSPYKVGEVVAVAQSYKDCGLFDVYQAPKDTAGWTNKMFVRADACKNRIRITNVRVERLQDISDEDCIAEGIYKDDGKTHFNGYAFQITRDQYGNMLSKQWYSTPREAYAALIDKIAGRGTFESNPYVFVYDFELVK